jgi:hypothetical protein
VFAGGEGEEVVLREHLGQTAVVCDRSRNDTTVSSDLDDVDFLVEEAYIIDVKWIALTKAQPLGIRTDTQDKERRCEEEEQGRQANRFAERADAMEKKNSFSGAHYYSNT